MKIWRNIKWFCERIYVDILFFIEPKIIGEAKFQRKCEIAAEKHLKKVFEREGWQWPK